MRLLERINDKLTKYQSSIQTVGILLVLLGLMMTIKEIGLTREELNLVQMQDQRNLDPNWRIAVEWDEDNSLYDKLVFSTSNLNIDLLKTKITLLDKTTPHDFEIFNSEFQTNSFKSKIEESVINNYKKVDDFYKGGIRKSGIEKYPIALTFTYKSYGVKIDTTILADYIFELYFDYGNDRTRIKSIGVEFQKYIATNRETIIRELIKHNINKSFLSYNPNAILLIQEDIISKDSLLKPVLELIKINSKMHSINSRDSINSFTFVMPDHYYHPEILSKRNKILRTIINNISADAYDDEIKSLILSMNTKDIELEKYKDMSEEEVRLKYCPQKGEVITTEELEEWLSINERLLTLLYSRTPI